MELYKRSFYTVSDFNQGRKISTNTEGEDFAFILGKFNGLLIAYLGAKLFFDLMVLLRSYKF